MMVNPIRMLVAAAALGLLLPAVGEAQLGALRRVKEAAKKAAGSEAQAKPAAATPAAQARSPYGEYVLELTPAAAERFARALAAEQAALGEFRQWAATVKSQEQYDACQAEAMMSAEGQQLTTEYVAAIEGKEGEAAMAAMTAFGKKLEAFVEGKCGPKPGELEQRRSTALQAAAERARTAGGFTAQQYAILKERVAPACTSANLAASSDGLKIPGDGTNIFWVYSATEVEVLKQQCGALQGALSKLL
jgi:hypothetical protein